MLMRSSISSDVDDKKTLETARLKLQKQRYVIEHKRFPLDPLWPGVQMKFETAHFAKKRLNVASTFRAISLDFEAIQTQYVEDSEKYQYYEAKTAEYKTTFVTRWEEKEDEVRNLPEYKTPQWPIRVEGKVFVDSGETGDRIYQIATDDQTKLQTYTVKIPLWKGDGSPGAAGSEAEVKVAFQPQFVTGILYFPVYKDSRVLLNMYFDYPDFYRFLDFGPDVQIPFDTQGQHVLFGKNTKSQTSMKHAYVDSKPEWTLFRNNSGDTQTVTLNEGTLTIEVKENSE